MSAIVFRGKGSSDADYVDWLQAHPLGFVLNRHRDGGTDQYLVLHKATCGDVAKPKKSEPGEFAERDSVKVYAETVQALREYARQTGRADGSFSNVCKHCSPPM